MTDYVIEHPWDKAPKGVDWNKWWAPTPSMQRWLPWGAEKKSMLPQIKHFYLSDSFRKGCADLGVIIDESDLAASGCLTFKTKQKGMKELIIDSASSLPIEAIYYMLVVQDRAKLQRICEYIDTKKLDEKNQQQDDILKQDLLNMVMTFHHLLGTNPSDITVPMLEQCIKDSDNYTPEQKQHFFDLLKKKRELIKAIMGMFEKMQIPAKHLTTRDKREVRIVIDKADPKAVQQAMEILKNLQVAGDVKAEIVDLEYLDPKIKGLLENKNAKQSDHKPMVEERFSWLLSSVGELEVLRKQFTQQNVSQVICGISENTSEFISGLGQALQVPLTLWAINNDVPPGMKHTFGMPRAMQVECLVTDPNLVKQHPQVCVLPSKGFTDLSPHAHPGH